MYVYTSYIYIYIYMYHMFNITYIYMSLWLLCLRHLWRLSHKRDCPYLFIGQKKTPGHPDFFVSLTGESNRFCHRWLPLIAQSIQIGSISIVAVPSVNSFHAQTCSTCNSKNAGTSTETRWVSEHSISTISHRQLSTIHDSQVSHRSI